jgi:hypothetical protein
MSACVHATSGRGVLPEVGALARSEHAPRLLRATEQAMDVPDRMMPCVSGSSSQHNMLHDGKQRVCAVQDHLRNACRA